MKKQWIGILIVGLSLGTAWAIRGQFGHEPGAAWAGGIGALALVLVSRRSDWYRKALMVALSSAAGWGAGGIISYGIVVGYGRSTDFLNAVYGLEMLFVIGGLFGLLGGGLVGLTLQSSKEKKVNWGMLLAEMVAGGILVHSFLIDQLEYLMTPPRSEAWAICLGAGLAMLWHMARNNYNSALRVAFYTSMGAGFGFAFGNFLQILGDVLEIKFNMWNVMEYNIGFWGGSAMAYGVFSSEWPKELPTPKVWENRVAILLVLILVPLIVFQSSVFTQILIKGVDLLSPGLVPQSGAWMALVVVLVVAVAGCWKSWRDVHPIGRPDVLALFAVYLSAYTVISLIVTGAFRGIILSNHVLYVVNIILVFLLLRNHVSAFWPQPTSGIKTAKWVQLSLAIVVIIVVLAFISVHLHDEMPGAHNRF
jgi:hypothetical protein